VRGGCPLTLRRYWLVALATAVVLLVPFAVFEALGVTALEDAVRRLAHPTVGAAFAGVALLVADVVLPVPSSLVMVAHGALFGVVPGVLLSVAGSTGATVVALAVGRRGGPFLDRLVPPPERARGDAVLRRWGAVALVVTRPVPVVAETTALLAGASRLPWPRALAAAVTGSVPPALVFALAGDATRDVTDLGVLLAVSLAASAGLGALLAIGLRRSYSRGGRLPVPTLASPDAGEGGG
jgi:uncharacterized membrane protein YdjX (TVP38/TMEM64 family)